MWVPLASNEQYLQPGKSDSTHCRPHRRHAFLSDAVNGVPATCPGIDPVTQPDFSTAKTEYLFSPGC
jgi:hypothetical protein